MREAGSRVAVTGPMPGISCVTRKPAMRLRGFSAKRSSGSKGADVFMASRFYQKLKWLNMLLGIGVVQLAFVAIANRVVEAKQPLYTEFQLITRQNAATH